MNCFSCHCVSCAFLSSDCGFGSRLCTSDTCKSLNDFCKDCTHDSCSCSEGFFQCIVESLGLYKCLPNNFKCDGEPDCEHGIDETDCQATRMQILM